MPSETPIRDGAWELWSYDPLTGVSKWVAETDTGFVIRTDTPTDALFKANNEAQVDSLNTRWGDGKIVASIPMDVFVGRGLFDAQAQGDDRYLSKFLNDSDNAKFRTRQGKV